MVYDKRKTLSFGGCPVSIDAQNGSVGLDFLLRPCVFHGGRYVRRVIGRKSQQRRTGAAEAGAQGSRFFGRIEHVVDSRHE